MPSNMSKESLYKEENATSEDGLLENQDDLDLVELENAPRLKQKSWKRLGSFRFLVFTHVVALVLYTAIFFTASRHYLQKLEHSPDLIYCELDHEVLEPIGGWADFASSTGQGSCPIRKEISS